MSDVMTTERPTASAPPTRRRTARAAAVAGAVLLAALSWAGVTDPLERGSGGYGVVSDVAPVASVAAPMGDTAYIATYAEGERTTLLFALTNTGRVPVRVTDVFPREERLTCGWVVEEVRTSPSTAADPRPLEPFWLSPREIVDVSVTGRFDCQGHSGTQQALSYVDAVPVRWSVAGVVPRTTRVPVGYRFGWTEDPEPFLTGLVDRDAAVRSP